MSELGSVEGSLCSCRAWGQHHALPQGLCRTRGASQTSLRNISLLCWPPRGSLRPGCHSSEHSGLSPGARAQYGALRCTDRLPPPRSSWTWGAHAGAPEHSPARTPRHMGSSVAATFRMHLAFHVPSHPHPEPGNGSRPGNEQDMNRRTGQAEEMPPAQPPSFINRLHTRALPAPGTWLRFPCSLKPY